MLGLRQFDDAALIFEQLQDVPDFTSCYSRDSQYDSVLARALRDAAVNLGHAHLLSGRWSEAIRAYKTARARLEPGHASLKQWLCRAHHGANNAPAARRALAAAIHMQPNEVAIRCYCMVRGVNLNYTFFKYCSKCNNQRHRWYYCTFGMLSRHVEYSAPCCGQESTYYHAY